MPIRQNRATIPQVDREKILNSEFEDLEPHERRWLQDTDYWPEGAEKEPVTFFTTSGDIISNDPTYLLVNGEKNSELLNQLIENRAQQLLAQREFEAANAKSSAGGTQGKSEFDDPDNPPPPPGVNDLDVPEPGTVTREVDYSEMSVQELRGLALSRGISIDGADGRKKDGNLISNLEKWDEEHPEGDED